MANLLRHPHFGAVVIERDFVIGEEIETCHARHFGSNHFRNLFQIDRNDLREGLGVLRRLESHVWHFQHDAFKPAHAGDTQIDFRSGRVHIDTELCSHAVRKNGRHRSGIYDEVACFSIHVDRNEQEITEVPRGQTLGVRCICGPFPLDLELAGGVIHSDREVGKRRGAENPVGEL